MTALLVQLVLNLACSTLVAATSASSYASANRLSIPFMSADTWWLTPALQEVCLEARQLLAEDNQETCSSLRNRLHHWRVLLTEKPTHQQSVMELRSCCIRCPAAVCLTRLQFAEAARQPERPSSILYHLASSAPTPVCLLPLHS